jgi:hypothetical protein
MTKDASKATASTSLLPFKRLSSLSILNLITMFQFSLGVIAVVNTFRTVENINEVVHQNSVDLLILKKIMFDTDKKLDDILALLLEVAAAKEDAAAAKRTRRRRNDPRAEVEAKTDS